MQKTKITFLVPWACNERVYLKVLYSIRKGGTTNMITIVSLYRLIQALFEYFNKQSKPIYIDTQEHQNSEQENVKNIQ